VSRRARTYWTCQAAGWSLYGAANLLLGSVGLAGPAFGRWAAGVCILSTLGVLVSHGLRLFYRRRRWVELGLLAALPRLVFACAVGGLVLELATALLSRTLGLVTGPLLTGQALVLVFNLAATLLIWSGFYFGFHYVERFRNAQTAALRSALAAQKAQLDLLRAQLNPHFVFNCLNSIRALITEDPARARTAVTQLGALLHYTLAADGKETVSVAEELAVVSDYLRLEAVRFEERLSIEVDLDPAVTEAQIPTMLLQMLVENAIKHGVAQVAEGGAVAVRGQRDGAGVRLSVRSPGQLRIGSPGVGLANARQRLALLYGDTARLELRADGTSAVLAEVYLPALAPPGKA
jgi:hypothetical protein